MNSSSQPSEGNRPLAPGDPVGRDVRVLEHDDSVLKLRRSESLVERYLFAVLAALVGAGLLVFLRNEPLDANRPILKLHLTAYALVGGAVLGAVYKTLNRDPVFEFGRQSRTLTQRPVAWFTRRVPYAEIDRLNLIGLAGASGQIVGVVLNFTRKIDPNKASSAWKIKPIQLAHGRSPAEIASVAAAANVISGAIGIPVQLPGPVANVFPQLRTLVVRTEDRG